MKTIGYRAAQGAAITLLIVVTLAGCGSSDNGATITTYDRIVVQMFDAENEWNSSPYDDAILSLYSTVDGTTPLARDEPALVAGLAWPKIEYMASMQTGDEFIIKADGNSGTWAGPPMNEEGSYVIRVLAGGVAGVFPGAPADPNLTPVNDVPNEDDHTTPPWSGGSPIQIGLDQIVPRKFADPTNDTIVDLTDVDYFRLVLP